MLPVPLRNLRVFCSLLFVPSYVVYGGILSVLFVCFVGVCAVTDFSTGALPIGVKFCVAVRPYLGQVFSYFGG